MIGEGHSGLRYVVTLHPFRQSSSVNDLPVPSKCRELSLRNSTGGVQISQKDGQELSDVDDDDLNGMILTDSEVEKKTAIWMEMNKEYLKDQVGLIASTHYSFECRKFTIVYV